MQPAGRGNVGFNYGGQMVNHGNLGTGVYGINPTGNVGTAPPPTPAGFGMGFAPGASMMMPPFAYGQTPQMQQLQQQQLQQQQLQLQQQQLQQQQLQQQQSQQQKFSPFSGTGQAQSSDWSGFDSKGDNSSSTDFSVPETTPKTAAPPAAVPISEADRMARIRALFSTSDEKEDEKDSQTQQPPPQQLQQPPLQQLQQPPQLQQIPVGKTSEKSADPKLVDHWSAFLKDPTGLSAAAPSPGGIQTLQPPTQQQPWLGQQPQPQNIGILPQTPGISNQFQQNTVNQGTPPQLPDYPSRFRTTLSQSGSPQLSASTPSSLSTPASTLIPASNSTAPVDLSALTSGSSNIVAPNLQSGVQGYPSPFLSTVPQTSTQKGYPHPTLPQANLQGALFPASQPTTTSSTSTEGWGDFGTGEGGSFETNEDSSPAQPPQPKPVASPPKPISEEDRMARIRALFAVKSEEKEDEAEETQQVSPESKERTNEAPEKESSTPEEPVSWNGGQVFPDSGSNPTGGSGWGELGALSTPSTTPAPTFDFTTQPTEETAPPTTFDPSFGADFGLSPLSALPSGKSTEKTAFPSPNPIPPQSTSGTGASNQGWGDSEVTWSESSNTSSNGGESWGFEDSSGSQQQEQFGFPPETSSGQQQQFGFPPETSSGQQQEQFGFPPETSSGQQQEQFGFPPETSSGQQQQQFGFPPETSSGQQQEQFGFPPETSSGQQQQFGFPPETSSSQQQQFGFPPETSSEGPLWGVQNGSGLTPSPATKPSLESLPLVDQLEVAMGRLITEERLEEARACHRHVEVLKEINLSEKQLEVISQRQPSPDDLIRDLKAHILRRKLSLAAQSVVETWQTPSSALPESSQLSDPMNPDFASSWTLSRMLQETPSMSPLASFPFFSADILSETAKRDLATAVRLKRCAVNSLRLMSVDQYSLSSKVSVWNESLSHCKTIFEVATDFLKATNEQRKSGLITSDTVDQLCSHFRVQTFFLSLIQIFHVFSNIGTSATIFKEVGRELPNLSDVLELCSDVHQNWCELSQLASTFQGLPTLPPSFIGNFQSGATEKFFPLNKKGGVLCDVCLLPVSKNEEKQHEACTNFVEHLPK